MKNIFKTWRLFKENRDAEIETDLGASFPLVTLEGLVGHKYTDMQQKAIILALLDLFGELEEKEVYEPWELKSKLKTLRIMSGNSPDFTFVNNFENASPEAIEKGRKKALQFYLAPYALPASPGKEKTKSLKDWHEHLKVVWSNPRSNAGEVERSRAIKAFHGDSPTEKPLDTPQAEVDVSGETWVNPLRPFRQHMTRGRP